jgi:hypothetical protein
MQNQQLRWFAMDLNLRRRWSQLTCQNGVDLTRNQTTVTRGELPEKTRVSTSREAL